MRERVVDIRQPRERAIALADANRIGAAPISGGRRDEPAGGYLRRAIAIGPDASSRAREALAEVDGISDATTRNRAQLLVSELVSHVARAASQGTRELELRVYADSGRLRVEAAPRGACPVLTLDETGAPTLTWELQVVAKLADWWGIHHDRHRVLWFEVEL
jgi:ATP phosphoribosyltransferase regulatory subunit HisZ